MNAKAQAALQVLAERTMLNEIAGAESWVPLGDMTNDMIQALLKHKLIEVRSMPEWVEARLTDAGREVGGVWKRAVLIEDVQPPDEPYYLRDEEAEPLFIMGNRDIEKLRKGEAVKAHHPCVVDDCREPRMMGKNGKVLTMCRVHQRAYWRESKRRNST